MEENHEKPDQTVKNWKQNTAEENGKQKPCGSSEGNNSEQRRKTAQEIVRGPGQVGTRFSEGAAPGRSRASYRIHRESRKIRRESGGLRTSPPDHVQWAWADSRKETEIDGPRTSQIICISCINSRSGRQSLST